MAGLAIVRPGTGSIAQKAQKAQQKPRLLKDSIGY